MEKLGKHNHKLTNILKVAIFSLVMLAPIGAVLSKVAYITFNKNAYESYYGQTINQEEYTEINNLKTGLEIGQEYILTKQSYQNNFTENVGAYIYGINVNNVKVITSEVQLENKTIVKISPYFNTTYNNRISLSVWYEDETSTTLSAEQQFIAKFQYVSNNLNNDWLNTKIISKVEYNNYSYMDNAFYYACYQITQEPLFKWTINTGTYTAINTMFTGLGMQSNHPLAICLCYWMICTMIYIVIDIVIFCITKLTHITNDE